MSKSINFAATNLSSSMKRPKKLAEIMQGRFHGSAKNDIIVAVFNEMNSANLTELYSEIDKNNKIGKFFEVDNGNNNFVNQRISNCCKSV